MEEEIEKKLNKSLEHASIFTLDEMIKNISNIIEKGILFHSFFIGEEFLENISLKDMMKLITEKREKICSIENETNDDLKFIMNLSKKFRNNNNA